MILRGTHALITGGAGRIGSHVADALAAIRITQCAEEPRLALEALAVQS